MRGIMLAVIAGRQGPMRINRSDDREQCPAHSSTRNGETGVFDHLPECRALHTDQTAVKDRMSLEKHLCGPFGKTGIELPVELHHPTPGGIARASDRIGEPVNGRGFTGLQT